MGVDQTTARDNRGAAFMRTDDQKAEAAVNALAALLVRENRGAWKPSATTNALLYFLGRMLSERTIPQFATDKLVAEIEDELRGNED
jgi:hypothetical protein